MEKNLNWEYIYQVDDNKNCHPILQPIHILIDITTTFSFNLYIKKKRKGKEKQQLKCLLISSHIILIIHKKKKKLLFLLGLM